MLRFVANVSQMLLSSERKFRNSSKSRGYVYENLEVRNLLASITFDPSTGVVLLSGGDGVDVATIQQVSPTEVAFSLDTAGVPQFLSLIHISEPTRPY